MQNIEGQTRRSQPRQSRLSEGIPPSQSPMPPAQASPSPLSPLRSEESWVDIASRQSASSLSSATEEIITTGLRVQHDSNLHRRRRARSTGQFVIGTGYRARSAGGRSSQEEYEESESESDHVVTSSTEGLGPSPLQHELRRSSRGLPSVSSSETMSEREGDDEGEDDDDENATAVNYPRSTRRPFAPRPNVFSHPPTTEPNPAQPGASYPTRRPAARSASQRHSYPQHSPYQAVSPDYQAEHDEALRASLSTLLSAAAAVRGLPKPGQSKTNTSSPSARMDPATLRMVPESVALGERTNTSTSSSRDNSTSPPDISKRKASPQSNAHVRSSSKDRRAIKKARIEEISPTLLTWVVSAGVVVLVSALSFSAGYRIGKESGHAEAMGQFTSVGGDAGRCSKEAASGLSSGAGMGLKRLRWSGGSGVRV